MLYLGDILAFDSSGNLILPKDIKNEYEYFVYKNPKKVRIRTNVYVTCSKCNRTWERRTKTAGKIKCRGCGHYLQVEAI